MVINALSTLALYCSRCGKIELHSISRFTMPNAGERQLTCSCGQLQATIAAAGRKQCLLRIPCLVCEVSHIICLDTDTLWRTKVERIYCPEENFELGFVGESQAVAKMIADNSDAVEILAREMDEQDGEDCQGNSRIILEILNKVHDIAEQGGVYCRCGSSEIVAEVSVDAVELTCLQCGGHQAIPAKTETDLAQLAPVRVIEIVPYRLTSHNN